MQNCLVAWPAATLRGLQELNIHTEPRLPSSLHLHVVEGNSKLFSSLFIVRVALGNVTVFQLEAIHVRN